ncbi:MAG: tripartite tricarboxylate transporter substrate binding protein [Deltaproteobacteria bacterium]|nr:tripartite tricarboxylate transporter substrate binding protein [Deltaproteobacteria bacterium]MDE0342821.1 tripartite tricarboxylate transporter substrate binding protein [Deltaproteobacteria bacterium]
MKRTFAALFAAFGLMVFAGTVQAEFPNRDITILVHASPGGGFDAIARALGRYMKPLLPKDVDVIVKNVVGAGGITGTVAMYRAKPDGYTIGHIYADGMLGTQMIRDNVGYDIDKFTWLAVVSSQEAEALLVRRESPYRTVKDLQKAKRVTWGVEGIGIARWVHAFLAANELKIPFDVVAGYGGTGETLPGLLRGDFDVFTQPIDHPSTLPYIRSGEIVPIVNLGESRAKNAPDTPTAIELGYKNLIVKVFRAMVGPPGLSKDLHKKWESLLLKTMDGKPYKDWAASFGIPLVPGNAAAAAGDMKVFVDLYSKYRQPMLDALKGKK